MGLTHRFSNGYTVHRRASIETVILREYLDSLPKGGRKEFADRLGIAPSYLSQLTSGIRSCGIELAAAIERESGGKCTVQELAPKVDWDLVRPRQEAA